MIKLIAEVTSFLFWGSVMSFAQTPQFIGQYNHPSSPASTSRDVAISGNFAYLAHNSGLIIVNVSDPTMPTLVNTVSAGNLHGVAVVGSYAYVADFNYGLRIIDVYDPYAPIPAGAVSTGTAWGVKVEGNYAYVVSGTYGLQIVDVSNPYQPMKLGNIQTSYAQRVDVEGSYAFIADGAGGLRIIDVSNPNNPILTGSLSTGYSRGIATDGLYAYVVDGYQGLKVIDVTNPSAPLLVGGYQGCSDGHGVSLYGDRVFSADRSCGMNIIDVHSPSSPYLVGSYTTGNAWSIAIKGSLAYIADGNSLTIVDVSCCVTPRSINPIVLVHGWTSNPGVWETIEGWLSQSGYSYVWSVDLEECGTQSEADFKQDATLMYKGNAEILANFIESQLNALPTQLRDCINEIDIIGHSMGGLVARRYISNWPQDPWTPQPVRNLIMLGTPNNGSPLAGELAEALFCPFGPAGEELHPLEMLVFNSYFNDNPYTNYYSVWGSGGLLNYFTMNPFCYFGLGRFLGYPNDGIVEAHSVVGIKSGGSFRYPNNYGGFYCHNQYPEEQTLFDNVINPILSGSSPKLSPDVIDPNEFIPAQISFMLSDSIVAGNSEVGELFVEINQSLSVYVFCSDSNVAFALTSPSSANYDSTSTSVDSTVVFISNSAGIRGFYIESAESGVWQWHLSGENASGNVNFTIMASCENAVTQYTSQNKSSLSSLDTLRLNTTVLDGTTGVTGLLIEVTSVRNETDTGVTFLLVDDGLHGDEGPNDGVYGAELTDLAAGTVEFLCHTNGMASIGPISRHTSYYAFVEQILICGDIDNNSSVDIADLLYMVDYQFASPPGPPPPVPAAANVDGVRGIDIADLLYLVDYMFANPPGPAPVCQ